jgi:DNA-binding transcriptional LysR family regulator
MAKQTRRPGRPSGPAPSGRRNKAAPAERFPPRTPPTKTAGAVPGTIAGASEQPRTFRLGAVEGATPGRWIDTWKARMPQVPIELVPIPLSSQRAAIDDVDAALVRLPLDDESLHVIRLYDEVPVVVAPIDSHLLAADELTVEDLAGETVIPVVDDPLGAQRLDGTEPARFPPLTASDAVATSASGVGIVVVPMSIARLHHRKDVDYRPLADGPTSTVGLAWRRDRTTSDVETFIGIVRGRTANSSR